MSLCFFEGLFASSKVSLLLHRSLSPVLCQLCNKSYALRVMKKHKHTKMHIENAKNQGMPFSWWFVYVGGHKPDAFPSRRTFKLTLSRSN